MVEERVRVSAVGDSVGVCRRDVFVMILIGRWTAWEMILSSWSSSFFHCWLPVMGESACAPFTASGDIVAPSTESFRVGDGKT